MKDRVAIVTGAGRGIGAATAKHLAAAGAMVVCTDIQVEPVEGGVEEIKRAGGRAGAARVDVSSKNEVESLISQVLVKYDRIDILINNAGITADDLSIKMSESAWDRVIEVNLKGTWIPSQAVIRPMRKRRWGRIVNTSSIAAQGNPGQANYSASKGGVISLTRTLALELAKSGITVNAVAPGAIETPMLERLSDAVRDRILERIPMGRFGSPDDVARVHLFLRSEAASYITGQVITIDGGMTIGL